MNVTESPIWSQYVRTIESYLSDYFERFQINNLLLKKLYDSMSYSIRNGGKRFRPVLALATAELLNKPIQYVLPYACAIEMIHTYSLIHDDLPCMDDDDIRRGLPTNHKVYGEHMALLAGDALVTEAFKMLTYSQAKPEYLIKSVQLLAQATGIEGMAGGQALDLESQDVNLNDLLMIHKKKTGALIQAAVMGTAVLCEARPDLQDILLRFSENLGLAFQVRDDLLDQEKNENINFVNFMKPREVETYLDSLTENALKNLEAFGPRAQFLSEIARYNQIRTK